MNEKWNERAKSAREKERERGRERRKAVFDRLQTFLRLLVGNLVNSSGSERSVSVLSRKVWRATPAVRGYYLVVGDPRFALSVKVNVPFCIFTSLNAPTSVFSSDRPFLKFRPTRLPQQEKNFFENTATIRPMEKPPFSWFVHGNH